VAPKRDADADVLAVTGMDTLELVSRLQRSDLDQACGCRLFIRAGQVVSVIGWLLDGDPAIRWQVLRDLTDAPAGEVAAERARVEYDGWGCTSARGRGSRRAVGWRRVLPGVLGRR
jgi:hypothetical protein